MNHTKWTLTQKQAVTIMGYINMSHMNLTLSLLYLCHISVISMPKIVDTKRKEADDQGHYQTQETSQSYIVEKEDLLPRVDLEGLVIELQGGQYQLPGNE